MRKVFSAVLGLVLLTSAVFAQTKNAEEDFTFSSDVRVGTQVLKPGDYHFICRDNVVTINLVTKRTGGDSYSTKVAELTVQTKTLPAKSQNSQLVMPNGKDGVPQILSFFIQGSNVEYVVSQQ
jgi:hypothetical protein